MTAETITWNSIRNDILSNPEVKEEYDLLTPGFEFTRTVISLREKLGLTQREFTKKEL